MPAAADAPDLAESDLPVPACVLKCREPGNPFGPEQTFYVLGTAHISSASCQDVEKLIRAVQPQVGCIPVRLEKSVLLLLQQRGGNAKFVARLSRRL